MRKTGGGTVNVLCTNAFTYTGGTVIHSGVVRMVSGAIAGGDLLPNAGTVNVTSNGLLDLNGYSDTVGGLAGDGKTTPVGKAP